MCIIIAMYEHRMEYNYKNMTNTNKKHYSTVRTQVLKYYNKLYLVCV